jgi:hypothetical protein
MAFNLDCHALPYPVYYHPGNQMPVHAPPLYDFKLNGCVV